MTLEQIYAMVDARCAAERADAISKWRGHRIRAGIIRAKPRREFYRRVDRAIVHVERVLGMRP